MTTGGEAKQTKDESAPAAEKTIGAKAESPRDRIVEALLSLAARRDFEDVTISDVAHEAGVSLADFRDQFPSKGAVLAAFSRKIDRQVLDGMTDEFASEPARERLYDVLRRRLMALAPYREGLASIMQWASTDPLAATALNRQVVNSMRFMLEAADIDSEGAVGALKLQGLALAWRRVLDALFEDRESDLARTLSALDKELLRGEKFVDRAEDFARLASPLRTLARAVFGGGGRKRARREHDDYDDDDEAHESRHHHHRHEDHHPHHRHEDHHPPARG
jgi:AcrR family transcriptional regulator